MAERKVAVVLDADTRPFQRSVNRAADQVDELARKAERVDGKNIRARATVAGAAEAAAEVAGVNREMSKLDGKHAKGRVSVDTGRSNQEIRVLGSSIMALGPAGVAAGAVAAGGIGAMGAALGTVVAGAGVTALAFADIGDALDKLSKAQEDPTPARLKAARIAMDALPASGRRFVEFLDKELEPALDQLKTAAKDGMLPGVESGLRDLLNIMPNVKGMVGTVADSLGDLAAKGGKALNDPFWRSWIDWVGRQARPTIEDFGRILGGLAEGFAGSVQAFGPLTREMLGWLGDLSQRFGEFGKNLSSSSGFREFVSYVREISPQVGGTLKAVAGALGAIVEAAAPLGGPVLSVIRSFADVIKALAGSPAGPALMGVVTALGSLNLLLKGGQLVANAPVIGLLGGLGDKGRAAEGGIKGANGALSGVSVAMAGALGALALGATAYDRMRSKADDLAKAVIDGQKTMDQAVREEQTQLENRQSAWVQAADEWAATQQRQATAIDDGKHALSEKILTEDQATRSAEKHAEAADSVTQKIYAQTWATDPLERATANAYLAQQDYTREVENFGRNSPQAEGAMHRWETATRDAEIAQIMARDGVDRMTASVQYQNDVLNGSVNADLQAERSKINYEQAVKRATDTLKTHSASSVEGRDAILGVKEAAVRSAQAAGEKAEADAKAAGRSDGATASAQAQKDEYLRLAEKTKDPLRSELIKLADRVETLPDGNFTVTGDGKVSGIKWTDAAGIERHIDPRYGGGGVTRATGGVLPGWSPGRDDLHFYSPEVGSLHLSGGEAILRPEATRAIGRGGIDAINRAARTGGVDGVRRTLAEGKAFAAGGVFQTGTHPYPKIATDLHDRVSRALVDAMAPKIAEQVRGMESALAGGGPAPAGSGPVVAQVQAVASRFGWGAGPQWDALSWLISHESGWRPTAQNPTSTAYGLFQFLNSTWGTVGGSKTSNPAQQAEYGLRYIRNRYGSPLGAKAFWQAHRWYDDGGIADGRGVMAKATLEPERVLSPRQTAAFEQLVDTLSKPRRVAVAAGAGAVGTAQAVRTGPAVQFGDVHLSEHVDVDLVSQRMEFAVKAAGL